MKNKEIARMLYEIADVLEVQEVQWKPRAYRKAARSIESLGEDIEEIYKKGKKEALENIPGVGVSIAEKIEEYLKTGKMRYYNTLKKKLPVDFDTLTRIPGLGPKKVKILYKKLGIRNIKDLEKAAKKGKIKGLEGFGEKSEQEILSGLGMLAKIKGRQLLGYMLPVAEQIRDELKKDKAVEQIELVGSLRRMKETIGDIDILVVSKHPKSVMDAFTSLKQVDKVIAKGESKSTIFLDAGVDCDLRVFKKEQFGAAMMYFTGSKAHNISLRKIVMKKGWKLNEYGLFKGKTQIAGKTEEDIYKKLGMQFIHPEMREDKGEIELAIKKKLPKLIGYNDVYGDLQMHSKWSDGANSIKEMAQAAKKLGHKYIAITDHSLSDLAIAHGLKESDFKKRAKEITETNKTVSGITVLQGVEANIRKDGSVDVPNKILKELDIVLAAVHSNFKMPKEKMTKRIMKAIDNEYVDILSHPTGRMIGKREPYQLDMGAVLDKAKETNTILEINAFPERLDLSPDYVREAVKRNIKISIGTDAHSTEHLKFIRYGIGTARRGWAEKKDIINTAKTVNELKKKLK